MVYPNETFTRDDGVLEVALGGGAAVAVSVLVFPERAHRLGLEAAARILGQMADVVPKLLLGFTRNPVGSSTW